MVNPTTNFLTEYWSQIALLIGIVISYLSGRQAKKDKHSYDKSLTFNIDIDTLADSFDLSQKMLATVRTELDETQLSLNKANQAYEILFTELSKSNDEIKKYKIKVKALGTENKEHILTNKELMKRLQTCDFACKNKVMYEKNIKTVV
jgi:hypothetical protein